MSTMDLPNSPNCSWYVVHTKPRQEARAAANLRQSPAINRVFLPVIHRRRELARRRGATETQPLFSRYLFVHCHLDLAWRHVIMARGVQSVVSFGATPACVPGELIASLHSREGSDGCVRLQPRLKPGDRVAIVSGALEGWSAVFDSAAKDAHRVHLLISAVSGQIRAVVDEDAVVPLPPESGRSTIPARPPRRGAR